MRRCLIFLFLLPALFLHAQQAEEQQPDILSELIVQAEEGDTEAMNYLGYLLISGEEGVEPDRAAGLIWLTKAAASGDAKAASNLGWLYIQGDLLQQDLPEGIKWLEKAADAGLPVAQSLLGDMYRDGRGLPQDSIAADSLYRSAFEHGLRDAGYKLYALNVHSYTSLPPEEKVSLGKYYYLRGAPSEGIKLFYEAADQGNADAMALLGDAYTRALGVPYDHDLSLKYYAKAAEAGNPSAQFVIGELLEIFPDALRAAGLESLSDNPAYWFEKAAAEGVTDAAIASERLLE